MNPIEIMAIIVAVLGLVKLFFVATNPKAWLKVVDFVFAKPNVTSAVSALLALIVLFFIIQEITIVQIFAVVLFVMLLILVKASAYAKEIKDLGYKILKDKNTIKKVWLAVVAWLILILWLFYEVFI